MDIQWLREFVQLSKTLNYRKTAELLFVTPSTLSKHIALLERELETQLLIRDTKSVQLTDNGRVFRDSASAIVREFDSVTQRLHGSHTIQGTLRIAGGIRFTKLNEIIYPAVSHFEQKYPDVSIYIEDIQFQDYRDLLLKNNFDVVFSVALPNMNTEGLDLYTLFELPLCIWVQNENTFSERDSVKLEELADKKLRVLEEEKCPLYTSYLKSLFSDRDIRIQLGKPLNQAFTMDRDDFGVTPLFSPSEHFGYGVRVIEIDDEEKVTFSLVRKHHISNPIAALFCEEFKEFFANDSVASCR